MGGGRERWRDKKEKRKKEQEKDENADREINVVLNEKEKTR